MRPGTPQRQVRDQAIVQRYCAGATLMAIAAQTGLSESGVWRVLQRRGALQRAVPHRAARSSPGRVPIWPDCPAHLWPHYRKIRAVIGSRAARDQLIALDARRHNQGSAAT